MIQHLISTFHDEGSICDTLQHFFCCSQLMEIHCKSQFFHPNFHTGKPFSGNLFISFSSRIDLPHIHSKTAKLAKTIRHNIPIVRK